MRKSILAACAVLTATSLAISGCSNSESTDTDANSGAAASGSAASGVSAERADDELVLALGDFGESEFDPAKGWGTHNEHKVLHSSLLKWTNDMELVGDLAESYEVDGSTWTFQLRDDFKFSDGEPVTAEDVVFTYEMLIDDGTNFDVSTVKEVRAKGDNTVVFELNEPDSLFGPLTALIGIVPEHAYGPDYSDDPIGSGPYKIVEKQVGEQVIMEANEHYPEDLHYKKLTFLLADEESAIAAANAGQVDVLKVSHNNADQQIEGMELDARPSVDTFALTLPVTESGNTGITVGEEVEVGNDVTADPAIRKAITLGLDREELSELVLNGYGKPAWSVADDLPWEVDFSFDDGQAEQALELLKEAGWEDTNGDGTVDKDGQEAVIPLMVPSNDLTRIDLGEAIVVQAEEFGIKFEPEHVTWDEIYEEGKTKSVVFALGSLSPKELWDAYATDAIDTAYNNMPNYSNPEVDQHFESARTAADFEASIEDWKAGQEAGANASPEGDVSMAWILRRDHLFFVADDVDLGGELIHGHGHGLQIFRNVEEWS
ncbi:ABC transporter substrate-binding protein [Corynebacterium pilosum]|uniref:Oligopeptide-binding protein OppA n=1 Tax=Corynebacterium pilosum TaxID=35756 RepID=A0A376CJ54_9CORY|nr:ABC transporter substrate-binding protein [Corynebacterium pilosum]STC68526.1 oligopeptide-binding protein OppA [Corynebacterium pilosum]